MERRKEEVIDSVTKDGLNLENYPEFNNVEAVVVPALTNNGLAMRFCSKTVKTTKHTSKLH